MKAEVKVEAVDCAVHSDDDTRVKDADWEPGTWCWVLDEHDTNWNSAPEVVAVKLEAEEAVIQEEEKALKSEHEQDDFFSAPSPPLGSFHSSSKSPTGSRSKKEEHNEVTDNTTLRRRCVEDEKTELDDAEHDEDDVASTPQILSSFSSSSPTTGLRSIKEETNKENNTNNTKLLCREDAEGNKTGGCKAEHNAAAIVSSAAQFVASSVASNPSTTGSRSQKGNQEVQHSKSRPDNDDDDEDTTNTLKIRHSTNRSVKSETKSDDGKRSDNTIAKSSTLGTNDPDPCDDTWRAGSWCWVPPAPKSGSRSDIVTSVASGFTGSKRKRKRKASEQARESRSEDGDQTGETGKNKCRLDDDNEHNNQNNTIAVTNRNFDRQQRDPFYDNWTTSCWCWESPSTNSGINDVALAAATSTGRRKKQKGSGQSRESRCIIRSKKHTTIGHHTKNNHTDIDDDDDTDAIVEFCGDQHDDDDYDSDDDSDDNDATTFSEKRWNKMYGRLVKYKKTYKSLTVTKNFDDKHNLQGWIFRQRTQYHKKVLCVDRINCLESIGFVWNPFDVQWNEMYSRLIKYKKTYKSITVIKKFDDKHNLQQWTQDQRRQYNSKVLCEDRINRLNSIDFVWDPFNAQWTKMYEQLVAYKKQYKSTCVPELNPADPQLGRWVMQQRKYYNNNKSHLTADRISRLDSIGFVWNPLDAQWAKMYDRLVKYKKKYKTTCVPYSYPADPQLGRWVSHQREYYHTNQPRLTTDRISRLDSISFVWNPFDAQWNEKYDRLVNYKKEYKTTCVPILYPTDPQLGRWVFQQRTSYNTNKSRLTADRIAQLDSIGFVWTMKNK